MSDVIELDFDRDVKEWLGSHFMPSQASTYTAQCPECDTEIQQDVDLCPGCCKPVVWHNSRTWKDIFGSPNTALKRLRKLVPSDEAGLLLMEKAGASGFATTSDSRRWNRLVTNVRQHALIAVVNRCAAGARGYGIVSYALNAGEKILRLRGEPAPETPMTIEIGG
jgi:hypothetical protein